ncbi:hypothetical protein BU16DRAFT_564423 [Lophium mytilinum]|uniref:Rhodopsin domain-containing protein n=1 Tax=Lophium mytilinum TaxID=390894 RepID=A0A6A6QI96_9PEZI|nr:hypothetical protein BU16DRAFT_564423 [Lophium mytilinum]
MSLLGRVETILTIVLLILAWLTVSLRFWVRGRMTKSLGWDDGFMLLSLVLFTCYSTFILLIIYNGGFDHLPVSSKVVKTINYVLLAESFYVLATTALKIALGLFFLRILTKIWQRRTFYVILAISSVYGCLYVFVVIFQCKDPKDLFIHVITDTCLPDAFLLTAGYLYSSINTVADWTFVLIPLVMLSTANMDRKTKFSVGIIMALGAVGSVGSILRIIYMKGIIFGPDFFANASYVAIYATVEAGAGIAAGSLATLRPLMRQAAQAVRLSIHRSSQSRSSNQRKYFKSSRTTRSGTEPFDEESQIMSTQVPAAGQRDTSSAAASNDNFEMVPTVSSRSDGEDGAGRDPWSLEHPAGQITKVVDVHVTSEDRIRQ